MKKLFCFLSSALVLAACQKPAPVADDTLFQNEGNPLFRDAFTSDPATLVAGERLYVYTGHDECFEDSAGYEGQYGYNLTNWRLYSTEDMQTWKSHGQIFSPTDFGWASGEAWAAQCIEKNGKFYFYLTAQGKDEYLGKCIGVAVSDSPAGPFVDAIGKPLVQDNMTDNGARGWWNDIDPTVLTDDDGTTWICWGNGTCFMAPLKDNMTELADTITVVSLPRYVEGPWLAHRGDKYYLIYVSMGQGRETISYAMSSSIKGPWEPMGEIAGMAENSFTIHPAVCEFKGHWYFFYHNGMLTLDGHKGSSGRRSVCVEEMFFNEDGTIKYIQQTTKGVSAIDDKN